MRRQKYQKYLFNFSTNINDDGDKLFWTIFFVLCLLIGSAAGAYWYFISPPETAVAAQTE